MTRRAAEDCFCQAWFDCNAFADRSLQIDDVSWLRDPYKSSTVFKRIAPRIQGSQPVFKKRDGVRSRNI